MDYWTFATPLFIFVAEVCVLTIGTLRIIFVARGYKSLAPIAGFFEILLWLSAMKLVMENLNNWSCYLAFAFGFTLGNVCGMIVENKLALGTVIVRIITHRGVNALIEQLRAASFGVTCVDARGASGQVQIVMTIVKRKQLPEVLALIESHQPNAFYAVDELQSACEGIFPRRREKPGVIPAPLLRLMKAVLPKVPSRTCPAPELRRDAVQ